MDSLLTISDLAKVLKVSTRTIHRLTHEERIPVVKIRGCVRFKERDVEILVARNTNKRKYKRMG